MAQSFNYPISELMQNMTESATLKMAQFARELKLDPTRSEVFG